MPTAKLVQRTFVQAAAHRAAGAQRRDTGNVVVAPVQAGSVWNLSSNVSSAGSLPVLAALVDLRQSAVRQCAPGAGLLSGLGHLGGAEETDRVAETIMKGKDTALDAWLGRNSVSIWTNSARRGPRRSPA